MRRNPAMPASAVDWLAPTNPASVLVVGRASGALAEGLAERGHRLTVVDHERDGVVALLRRVPAALPVVGATDALPFQPCAFDAVFIGQSFHTLAPGLALAEFARVLLPGGTLAVTYTVRDDSVPWVRRLIARLREDVPNAMAGNYGTESVAALETSGYFTDVQQRSVRLWVPIDRAGLLAMVARTLDAAGLDPATRQRVQTDVGALYDASAKPPEPLLLPYQVRCWRARVDHSELSAPLELTEGLQITL